ncbi:MAG: hypothetical protein GF419_00275, partial [Ignavibacteriales bacterium]|nr:hypothetical protein [Ignavibacteriales bacterium]
MFTRLNSLGKTTPNKKLEDGTVDITALNAKIRDESAFVDLIRQEISKVIVGQKDMVDRLLIGLLANGHILLEGVPG